MEPDGGLRAWCSTPSEPSSAGACCVCKFNASQGANPKADSPRSGPAPAMNACQLNSVAESVAGATGRYRVSPLSPPLASCDPPDAPVAVMTKRVPKRTRRAHGAHPSAPPHSRPPWCAGGNPSHSGVPPPPTEAAASVLGRGTRIPERDLALGDLLAVRQARGSVDQDQSHGDSQEARRHPPGPRGLARPCASVGSPVNVRPRRGELRGPRPPCEQPASTHHQTAPRIRLRRRRAPICGRSCRLAIS
jgi:hypothetical protein